jgi:hypothetical protein
MNRPIVSRDEEVLKSPGGDSARASRRSLILFQSFSSSTTSNIGFKVMVPERALERQTPFSSKVAAGSSVNWSRSRMRTGFPRQLSIVLGSHLHSHSEVRAGNHTAVVYQRNVLGRAKEEDAMLLLSRCFTICGGVF